MSESRGHNPQTVWILRRGNYRSYVRTLDLDTLGIVIDTASICGVEVPRLGFALSRADARLLARRINQCLDETRGMQP